MRPLDLRQTQNVFALWTFTENVRFAVTPLAAAQRKHSFRCADDLLKTTVFFLPFVTVSRHHAKNRIAIKQQFKNPQREKTKEHIHKHQYECRPPRAFGECIKAVSPIEKTNEAFTKRHFVAAVSISHTLLFPYIVSVNHYNTIDRQKKVF